MLNRGRAVLPHRRECGKTIISPETFGRHHVWQRRRVGDIEPYLKPALVGRVVPNAPSLRQQRPSFEMTKFPPNRFSELFNSQCFMIKFN
jgi:hypothetical protein